VARATTISNVTPIFSAILAVAFLGETLSWRLTLGTVLVVGGVALTVLSEGEAAPAALPAVRRGWSAGALLALNTAFLASISFLLRKIGLRLLPDPVLGAALTVTSSLVVVVPFIAARWRWEPLRANRGSLGTLIAGGVLSTGGFLSYYLALNLGDVVRVTPLSNTTPLFALVLLFMFRQVEHLVPGVVVGALLAVAGVLLVVAG
jgi:drug/metabolite transporter (DMT)-like permease